MLLNELYGRKSKKLSMHPDLLRNEANAQEISLLYVRHTNLVATVFFVFLRGWKMEDSSFAASKISSMDEIGSDFRIPSS